MPVGEVFSVQKLDLRTPRRVSDDHPARSAPSQTINMLAYCWLHFNNFLLVSASLSAVLVLSRALRKLSRRGSPSLASNAPGCVERDEMSCATVVVRRKDVSSAWDMRGRG